MSINTVNINPYITKDMLFVAIDGYMMKVEIAEHYRRTIPMRVLRAIDVIDSHIIDVAMGRSYYSNVLKEFKNLDFWSWYWVSRYLGYYDFNIHSRERDILFNRLVQQYEKEKNNL